VEVVFGPPGTGKTTELLNLVDEELRRGTAPERIAFVSFTKAAVQEAAGRAQKKFGLAPRSLRWFRTLHSLAFSALGLARESVMGDWRAFGEACGFEFSPNMEADVEAIFGARARDDLLARAYSLVAASGLPLETVAQKWSLDISPLRYDALIERLAAWKTEKGLLDFGDMLAEFILRGQPLDVDVAVIDEAQDLTPQQWELVRIAFARCRRLVVAGDDDQAIYSWCGADVERLLELPGEQRVLNHSYRLPAPIHRLALSVASRIKRRHPKAWLPADHPGLVGQNALLPALDMSGPETWLLLARNGYGLPALLREVRSRGLLFRVNGVPAVPEATLEAYRTLAAARAGKPPGPGDKRRLQRLLARGRALHDEDAALFPAVRPEVLRFLARVAARGHLSEPPRIDVSTIHQAKGAEADNVALAPDISDACARALRSPEYGDGENRVLYVAVTRARRRLFLLRAETDQAYRFETQTVGAVSA